MNYDHNKIFGLFKFQSSYIKLYLNSPKGYSRKLINVQTVGNCFLSFNIMYSLFTLKFSQIQIQPDVYISQSPEL